MKTEIIQYAGQEIVYQIGQNAADNFAVLDESTNPEDVWFHAGGDTSSCHVLLHFHDMFLDKRERRQWLKRGALLCKQHTAKLRASKQVEIIYTSMKNVKKGAHLGQVFITNSKSIMV